MEPQEQSTARSIRLALVAFGLLALLGVVAFASRSGFSGSSNAKPTPGYVSYAFSAFLIVFVVMIPIAAYTFIMQAREGEVVRKSFRSRVLQNIATAALFGLIGFGVIYLKRHHATLFHVSGKALQNISARASSRHTGKTGAFQPSFEWPVLAVALAVLAVGGAFAYRTHRARRRRIPVRLEPTVAEDFATTIADAIAELDAEPDARRAVIAAYARMEGVLGRHGLRREPSETPVEYLARVLGDLTSRSDAVARLTHLFEEAKFSRHEIDHEMKHDAIEALRAIRTDLQEADA